MMVRFGSTCVRSGLLLTKASRIGVQMRLLLDAGIVSGAVH